MSRAAIAILAGLATGVGTFFLFPPSWVIPMFLTGIAGAFVSGVAARIDTKAETTDSPMRDLALSALNIPAQPLAKVPDRWTLHCFFGATSFLVGLALPLLFDAHA